MYNVFDGDEMLVAEGQAWAQARAELRRLFQTGDYGASIVDSQSGEVYEIGSDRRKLGDITLEFSSHQFADVPYNLPAIARVPVTEELRAQRPDLYPYRNMIREVPTGYDTEPGPLPVVLDRALKELEDQEAPSQVMIHTGDSQGVALYRNSRGYGVEHAWHPNVYVDRLPSYEDLEEVEDSLLSKDLTHDEFVAKSKLLRGMKTALDLRLSRRDSLADRRVRDVRRLLADRLGRK